jgi:hypothetical protein
MENTLRTLEAKKNYLKNFFVSPTLLVKNLQTFITFATYWNHMKQSLKCKSCLMKATKKKLSKAHKNN